MKNVQTRILIVEERLSDYELAQREISNSVEHCIFDHAQTEKQFLQALDQFQPDLILADYSLTGSNGLKVIQVAKERSPLTPLIIWSSPIGERKTPVVETQWG
jgi:CheY-like chemotaxis protein